VTFPILIAAGQEASDGDLDAWEPFMESVPLCTIREPELLLDRMSLMLHVPVSRLPAQEQQILRRLSDPSEVLATRRALIVDDDIRNIFAMTSVLERYGMDVLSAETGRDAIDLLEANAGIEVVLMDIMMPEMDGYETIREIRSRPRFRSLPIVAVTAKAMVGDRQKCREAGASDYIPKPVDTDQLVRVMAGWLRQRSA
jgi:CheY-like chemotaxis protein